jgi:hypothetical protein
MNLIEINYNDGGGWKMSYPVDWQTFVLVVLKLGAVLLERWTVGQVGLR